MNELFFYNCIKIDNDIWFSAMDYNGLYRYNLERETTIWEATFPGENMLGRNLYYQVRRYHHFLVFVPSNAATVSIYDTEEHSFRQVKIPSLKKKSVSISDFAVPDFAEGVIYQDILYIIGYAYPAIIKINLKTEEIKLIQILHEKKDRGNLFFGVQIVMDNNLLYIPCYYRNSVYIFDMNCDKGVFWTVGKESNHYYRIVQNGKSLYMLTNNCKYIVCWDRSDDSSYEIELDLKENMDAHIIPRGNYIWVFPNVAEEIYKIDKINSEIKKISLDKRLNIEYVANYQDGIVFRDFSTYDWFCIDDEGIVLKLNIHIKEPRKKKEVWNCFNEANMSIMEKRNMPLRYLVYRLQDEKGKDKREDADNYLVGRNIWEKDK